jgi:NitT/TauT family transport system permease protein
MPRRIAVHSVQAIIIALLILVWEFAPSRLLDELLWSRPSAIYQQMLQWLASGILLSNALVTLKTVLIGIFFGGSTGVLFGLLAGLNPSTSRLVNGPIEALFAVPKITLVPLFILWFGIGAFQHVVFTSLVVFFFFYFSMYNGVRSVPVSLRNTFRLSGASPAQSIRILYLPASLGWIVIALRLAMPYAFVAAVSTEVIASTDGLGNLVKNSASIMNSAGMFSAMLALLFVSIVCSTIVNRIANNSRWKLD